MSKTNNEVSMEQMVELLSNMTNALDGLGKRIAVLEKTTNEIPSNPLSPATQKALAELNALAKEDDAEEQLVPVEEEKRLSKGKKIAIGVGAGVAVTGLCVGAFFLGRKSATKSNDIELVEGVDYTVNSVDTSEGSIDVMEF